MLHLRLSALEHETEPLGRRLEEIEGIERVLAAPTPGEEVFVLSADVAPGSADLLLDVLRDMEIEDERYVLTRHDVVAPISARAPASGPGFAWLEVLGEARSQSRLLGRYLVMMAVAGTIASLGVLTSNAVLIVGAMAVSPDLLPICATCVAIVGRKGILLRRALGTLLIGVAFTVAAAVVVAVGVSVTGLVVSGFEVGESSISKLAAHVDYSTVLVALAAGVAAMLAFETRASAAVGVAISVTTVPASAYLGVALGTGEISEGLRALAVLALNITLLMLSGSATLAIQRTITLRRGV